MRNKSMLTESRQIQMASELIGLWRAPATAGNGNRSEPRALAEATRK